MNSTYGFTLNEGPKVRMGNFWGTKNWRKFLEGLKRKVDIFIRTKNIFNPAINVPILCVNIIKLSFVYMYINMILHFSRQVIRIW